MKTNSLINDNEVTIEWETGDVIDIHDHETHYAANGIGDDGIEYIGTAIYIDGEFEEITDIETA